MAPWPLARATIDHEKAVIAIAGITRTLPAPTIEAGRDAARRFIASWAAHFARPINADVADPDGSHTVLIDENGHATLPSRPRNRRKR